MVYEVLLDLNVTVVITITGPDLGATSGVWGDTFITSHKIQQAALHVNLK